MNLLRDAHHSDRGGGRLATACGGQGRGPVGHRHQPLPVQFGDAFIRDLVGHRLAAGGILRHKAAEDAGMAGRIMGDSLGAVIIQNDLGALVKVQHNVV